VKIFMVETVERTSSSKAIGEKVVVVVEEE
jgi:hypothetical protein